MLVNHLSLLLSFALLFHSQIGLGKGKPPSACDESLSEPPSSQSIENARLLFSLPSEALKAYYRSLFLKNRENIRTSPMRTFLSLFEDTFHQPYGTAQHSQRTDIFNKTFETFALSFLSSPEEKVDFYFERIHYLIDLETSHIEKLKRAVTYFTFHGEKIIALQSHDKRKEVGNRIMQFLNLLSNPPFDPRSEDKTFSYQASLIYIEIIELTIKTEISFSEAKLKISQIFEKWFQNRGFNHYYQLTLMSFPNVLETIKTHSILFNNVNTYHAAEVALFEPFYHTRKRNQLSEHHQVKTDRVSDKEVWKTIFESYFSNLEIIFDLVSENLFGEPSILFQRITTNQVTLPKTVRARILDQLLFSVVPALQNSSPLSDLSRLPHWLEKEMKAKGIDKDLLISRAVEIAEILSEDVSSDQLVTVLLETYSSSPSYEDFHTSAVRSSPSLNRLLSEVQRTASATLGSLMAPELLEIFDLVRDDPDSFYSRYIQTPPQDAKDKKDRSQLIAPSLDQLDITGRMRFETRIENLLVAAGYEGKTPLECWINQTFPNGAQPKAPRFEEVRKTVQNLHKMDQRRFHSAILARKVYRHQGGLPILDSHLEVMSWYDLILQAHSNSEMTDQLLTLALSDAEEEKVEEIENLLVLSGLKGIEIFDSGNAYSDWPLISYTGLTLEGSRRKQDELPPLPPFLKDEGRFKTTPESEAAPVRLDRKIRSHLRKCQYDSLKGRTLLFNCKGKKVALKIRRKDETRSELVSEVTSIEDARASREELKLEGYIPEVPEFAQRQLIEISVETLDHALTSHSAAQLLKESDIVVTEAQTIELVLYEVDSQIGYYRYLNDPSIEEPLYRERMLRYIRDLARYLKNGVVPTSIIELYHNLNKGREDEGEWLWNVDILREQLGPRVGTGRSHAWTKAVEYPNGRISGVADYAELIRLDDLLSGKHPKGAVLSKHLLRFPKRIRRKIAQQTLIGTILTSVYLIESKRRYLKDDWDWSDSAFVTDHALWLRKMADQFLVVYSEDSLQKLEEAQVRNSFEVEEMWSYVARQLAFFLGKGREYADHLLSRSVPTSIYGPGVFVEYSDDYPSSRGWGSKRKENGYFSDGIHEDTGPKNGPFLATEMIRVIYLYSYFGVF